MPSECDLPPIILLVEESDFLDFGVGSPRGAPKNDLSQAGISGFTMFHLFERIKLYLISRS
jgi:hypothetical protein